MNALNTTLRARQRGSFFVTVVMLVLLGAALTCVLKIAPAYTGNAVLKNSMIGIIGKSEYRSMNIEEIRVAMIKSLQVNPVDGFDAMDMVITQEAGKQYLDINYEVRIPIVLNVSALVTFKNRYDKN